MITITLGLNRLGINTADFWLIYNLTGENRNASLDFSLTSSPLPFSMFWNKGVGEGWFYPKDQAKGISN